MKKIKRLWNKLIYGHPEGGWAKFVESMPTEKEIQERCKQVAEALEHYNKTHR